MVDIGLLERTFQSLDCILTHAEAIDKAKLFLFNVEQFKADVGDDYWIQIGAAWDLNVTGKYVYGEWCHEMCLYRCGRNQRGRWVTYTDSPYPIAKEERF